MKMLVWVLFAVLMAVWTGFVGLSAGIVNWLLSAVVDGQVSGAAEAVAQWPIPAWLGVWVDVSLLEGMQATWLQAVHWLGGVLPSAGALTGWVVPLLWVVWGMVSLCLLAAAGVGHLLAGRAKRPGSRPIITA
jgi:hypothetical protein